MEFAELCELAETRLAERNLPEPYLQRLRFEIAEIQKQGAESVWQSMYLANKRYSKNPSHLLLPWLLGLVVGEADTDPLANRKLPVLNSVRAAHVASYRAKHGGLPPDFVKDSDFPDIDLDCLPAARDPIKDFAAQQYGADNVCSVGTWQTYKFRQAYIDVQIAFGVRKDKHVKAAHRPSERQVSGEDELPAEIDFDELRELGMASCKGKITVEGKEIECGHRHGGLEDLQRALSAAGKTSLSECLTNRDLLKRILKDAAKCPKCPSFDTEHPTFCGLLYEHDNFLQLYVKPKGTELISRQELLDYALQLIGRVRNAGMHAGALIIANRVLYGNIPMSKNSKKGYWVSLWSEGRNTQLSKFGYIKWDILGLKTLEYIYNCCKLIEENRGISFGERMSGWDDIDPLQNRAGHFFDRQGVKHYIDLNDPAALGLANAQKTDAIFQFDTDLAKSILTNKVRNFEDLMLLNAMGHPGPMASIPEAVANRDDTTGSWRGKMNETILEILDGTHGVIVYQEQLQAIWQRLAGFTAPEAQEARKAVAKKWTHKLKPIRDKWIVGASKTLGPGPAEDWWPKMETFGRYAFNRSHAVSYCLVAYRCLWLKAHFAPEFWAAVMNDCKPDKLVRYMGVARVDGWQPTEITKLGRCPEEKAKSVSFGTLNIENLTTDFTVTGNTINQGMIGIKGVGESAAEVFEGRGTFKDIDDFIGQKGGKDKTVMERFIKLGAFRALPGHENAKALWNYYMFRYGSGAPPLAENEKLKLAAELGIDVKKLTLSQWKKSVRQQLLDKEGWDTKAIEAERARQINEYKTAFPKRNKIPEKFHNWMPKPEESRSKIMALFPDDYELKYVLGFEEEYLGYYLHSPIDVYNTKGNCTIAKAKEVALKGGKARLEVLIKETEFARTKTGKDYARVYVTDGMQDALVFIWNSELAIQRESKPGAGDFPTLAKGVGVEMCVDYDEQRGTFSLQRGVIVKKLLDKNWRDIQ